MTEDGDEVESERGERAREAGRAIAIDVYFLPSDAAAAAAAVLRVRVRHAAMPPRCTGTFHFARAKL